MKQRVFSSTENALLNMSMKYHGFFRFGHILRLQGPFISFEALQTAVGCLQRRHPFLRSRLRTNPAARNTYLLEEDSTLQLKIREIPRKCDDHLQFWKKQWREREKDAAVIGEGLIEFWLLQDPDDHNNDEAQQEIVIICEHCISDGISFNIIAHELLLALGEEDKSIFNTSLDWSIPMETAIEQNVSRWSRFTTVSKFIVSATYQYMTLGRNTARIPYATVDFPLNEVHEHCHTETFYGSLSKEETQALFDKCHHEGVTVTSIVTAVMLRAISPLVNNKDGNLAHITGVDLRRRYRPPMLNSSLSYQVAGTGVFYLPVNYVPSTTADMWNLARKFGRYVNESIEAGEIFATGILSGKLYEREEGPFNTKTNPTSGITSWGRLTFQEQYGRWKLVGMLPLGNMVHSFTPIAFVYTVNGVLSIASSAPAPLFSSEVLEQLQNNTMKHLRQMIV